jgi:hypothetical protein
MVLNAIFSNISVISWWLVLLARNPEYPKIATDLWQVTDRFDHNVVSSTRRQRGFELTTLILFTFASFFFLSQYNLAISKAFKLKILEVYSYKYISYIFIVFFYSPLKNDR